MTESPAVSGAPGVNPIDALYDALSRGDAAAARESLADDAVVWHGFDRVARDRDEIYADWATLITTFPERKAVDVRRQPTAEGFVQQHLWVMRSPQGPLLAWPVCVVVTVRDNRIVRLDEYMDRAGHFTPDDTVLAATGSGAAGEGR